ncbi:MAG: chitobiase/beta-hexosaminidase C-terminal domain-containing protein, partial [Bacteroidaceae bacterium]|nr:chitobiase/beta-hexosaminidase C-terminal domain-containing protein [Bacteroidaceae bacterium]
MTPNDYASVSGTTTTGTVNVSSLPETDITLTLTVTATADGGTPAAPANTTFTDSKQITIQGTKPSAPTISVSGTSVTMSTDATGTTSIRYTLDGTEPTATTGTEYSRAIDLSSSTTSPVTIKAVTVRNGNASAVSEQTVTLTLPAPTIDINGSAGTATISATSGATIYYTTNGSTPSSTNGTAYPSGGISGLTMMQTVKAIAIKSGWNNSPVASGTVTIPSGINTTTNVVTLFDCEDHNWSYYSDETLPKELRSLNPADIQITYYGNGQSDVKGNMTNDSENGAEPNSFTLKATGVQVGPNDAANTFVYYKTLERTDGSTANTASQANGNLKYTTIPNPFQVRPTNGTLVVSTSNVYITGSAYGGTISVSYTDANGEPQTWSKTSTNQTETITVMDGTTLTVFAQGRNWSGYSYSYSTVTAKLNNNNGATIATATCTNVNYNAGTSATRTVGTVSSDIFRGFYAWRIKSLSEGLTIVGHEEGDTIHAESPIQFQTSKEYGNAVEFEALWAQANVTTGSGTLSSYYSSSVTSARERNFHVANSGDDASSYQQSYPHTVIGRLPGSTTASTTTIKGSFTAAADTKFEDITITDASSSTWTANGHDLIVGRDCSGTVNLLTGINGSTTNPNYHIRIESARFNYVSLLNGYYTYDDNNTNGNQITGSLNTKITIGSDFDRADDDSNGPEIYYNFICGSGNARSNNSSNSMIAYVKSGQVGSYWTIDNNSSYKAPAEACLYMGIAGNTNWTTGHRQLFVEGGTLASIAGGIDGGDQSGSKSFSVRMSGGKVRGAVYGGGARSAAYGDRIFVFTGGNVVGWIGGGCNGESGSGTTYVGTTNGESFIYFGGKAKSGGTGSNVDINGSTGGIVFGAGKGISSSTSIGQMANGTNIVVADECDIEHHVYGGGNYGYAADHSNIYITGGTVHGGVYGGSNQNNGPGINIKMTGGTIEGGLYGGSNSSGTVTSVTMNVNGGQVGTTSTTANIHGGGYGNSTTISGNVNMTIGASTSATDWAKIYGNVYGGSALGTVSGNATITMNKGEINGNLFGGALGNNTYAALVNGNVVVTVNGGKVTGAVFGCNDENGTPKGTVTVTINGTDATVINNNVKTYALQGVYGGGNKAHYDPTNAANGYPKVIVNGCTTSINEVYGGGNAAAVPQTDVTINGGDIGSVFAGGNGKSGTPANVGYQNKLEPTTANSYGAGTASAKIYGGTIHQVFGGSNARGVIRAGGTIEVDKSKATGGNDCDLIVKEIYGGGNKAAGAAGAITIGCTGAKTSKHSDPAFLDSIGVTLEGIGSVYGGANKAEVSNNIELNINSGIVANVFGGNNQEGTINGTITVNIEKTSESDECGWFVGNVFGGGNLADYSGNPTVNIKNGTVSGNVYGGGNGDSTDVSQLKGSTAAPTVTIGDQNHNAYQAIVLGDVYGGGNAAKITGDAAPQVRVLNKANTEIGNVYGGGNAADVPATDVIIEAGTISGSVYGGGHGDKISLNEEEGESGHSNKAANVIGNTSVQIRGGVIGKVFAGSNINGTISGTACTLSIAKSDTTNSPMMIGEVYGGGNMADGNATNITIGCTGTKKSKHSDPAFQDSIGITLEGIGTVYGGANKANIGEVGSPSNITLNINNGMVANVYGGNNTSGTIYGSIQVNINQLSSETEACGWYVGNVFGGGNLAVFDGTPTVNIKNGIVSGNVYGGGNGDPDDQTQVPGQVAGTIVNIGDNTNASGYAVVIGNVYGGGNAAKVTGKTKVTYDDSNNSSYVAGLFGGGNAANVGDSTIVTLTNGKVTDGIYGGCDSIGSVGTVTIALNGGRVGADAVGDSANVYGGGFGVATTTLGNIGVTLGNATVYGDIYGGSALGKVNASTTDTTTVTISGTNLHGSVFGGGQGDDNTQAVSYGN